MLPYMAYMDPMGYSQLINILVDDGQLWATDKHNIVI